MKGFAASKLNSCTGKCRATLKKAFLKDSFLDLEKWAQSINNMLWYSFSSSIGECFSFIFLCLKII